MISRGHTVFQVSNNFDSSLELFVYRYIGILEFINILPSSAMPISHKLLENTHPVECKIFRYPFSSFPRHKPNVVAVVASVKQNYCCLLQ
jgi:hypothetical protein